MDYKRYQINERVINDLKKRSTIGLFFYVAISIVIIYTDNYYQRNPGFSTLFLSSIIGICIFRSFHLVVMKKTAQQFKKAHYFVFMTSVVLTAIFWGYAFATFMVQDGEHIAKFLMGISIAGLAAGGVVAFIPERRLAITFNIFMLIPAAVVMLINGLNLSVTVAIFLFSVYLILITFRGCSEYWDALENEALLMKKSKALEKMSQIDVLTGLYNRRYFDDVFSHEWKLSCRTQSKLSIIICDIDHFKKVNDEHGHLAGDEYLKKTADVLTSVFKRETDVVARFGGEEFVILLPETDSDTIYEMAERFRAELEDCHVDYNDKKLKTTISLGIAHCIPDQDMDIKSLLERADKALYAAKNEGRNRVRVI